MSTSTSLRTDLGSTSRSGAGCRAESAIRILATWLDLPGRERTALRELLELVASRASAEAEANGARTTQDAKVDAEYARTRSELIEKFVAARPRGADDR